MRRLVLLYRTSVGKKIVMAGTGLVLLLFVIGHMLGNLKIFTGQKHFDEYAAFLRTVGEPLLPYSALLWIARIILLVAVTWHIAAAVQLTLMSRAAREVQYTRSERLAFSYASYTMRWGGVVILAFVIYHLLHFTFGTVHRTFIHGKVYDNVVSGFQVWPVAIAYILAMVTLALHIYHGLWSSFQTLGINNPRYNSWRRPLARTLAVAIFIGYVSVPVAVLAGFLR